MIGKNDEVAGVVISVRGENKDENSSSRNVYEFVSMISDVSSICSGAFSMGWMRSQHGCVSAAGLVGTG